MIGADPDVIAYDEDHGVLYAWQGCPEVTDIDDLPLPNRVAKVAVETAALIRRRDGYVLFSVDGDTGFTTEQQVPVEPVRLERVDLIAPPEELEEHVELTDDQLLRIALFTALLEGIDDGAGSYIIEDIDIVRALKPDAALSIERRKEDGAVLVRAHLAGLTVMPVIGEAPKPRKRASRSKASLK